MATPSLRALLCLSTLASATGLHVFLSGARPIRARIAVCASRTLPIRACSSIGPEQRNALRQAFHAPDAEFDENDPNNRVIKPKRRVDDDTDTDGAAATGGVRANTLNHAPSDAEKPSSMPNSPGLTQPPVPAEAPGADALPWVLRDLPLLRVPWVALPGFRQMYHVHEAHYCQMFEELVTTHGGPTAAANGRFGHLLLAGGSASLGTEAAQLEPEGSVAPIIGALMEVRNLDRLDDGRLVVVAHAVSTAFHRPPPGTQTPGRSTLVRPIRPRGRPLRLSAFPTHRHVDDCRPPPPDPLPSTPTRPVPHPTLATH